MTAYGTLTVPARVPPSSRSRLREAPSWLAPVLQQAVYNTVIRTSVRCWKERGRPGGAPVCGAAGIARGTGYCEGREEAAPEEGTGDGPVEAGG